MPGRILKTLAGALLPSGIRDAFARRGLRRRHGIYLSGSPDDYQIVQTSFGRKCRIAPPAYIACSTIGAFSYIDPYCRISRTDVGKFCSIAAYTVIGPPDHPLNRVSTHPAFFLREPQYEYTFIGQSDEPHATTRTTLGNDVWIGAGAVIRRGVNVGDGAVIGAGAVVVKDVRPYAIVGGVPARILRYRFEPEVIARLLASRWWDRDEVWLRSHAPMFAHPQEFLDALDDDWAHQKATQDV